MNYQNEIEEKKSTFTVEEYRVLVGFTDTILEEQSQEDRYRFYA